MSCLLYTSPSKTFNIPSLQGSYVILPDFKIYEAFETMTRYTEFVNSPAILGVLSTIEAYRHCAEWVDDLCSYLYDNLKYTESYIQKHMPKLKFQIPEGCYFCLLYTSDFQICTIRNYQHRCHIEGSIMKIGRIK